MTVGHGVITDWGTNSTGARFTFKLANGMLRTEIAGSGQAGTTLIADNTWHHVAVTYDDAASPNKYNMYIDGVLEMSFNMATTVNSGTTVPLRIGMRLDDNNPFAGTIDEVRVWDYARTQVQISADMNTEYCGPVTGLVAYHKLNNGIAGGINAGATISVDGSGSGNNGALTGFALTGATSNWVTGNIAGNGVTGTQVLAGCDGFSTTVGGNTYTSTGIYTAVLVAANGCDSIVTTNLTVAPAIIFSQTLLECDGFSITVGSNTYTTTGIYTDVLVGASTNGCDSTVATTLLVAAATNVATTTSGLEITATATGATYQWIDCNNGNAYITGETGQTYTATTAGSYAVEVTAIIGNCTDTSLCETVTPVGVGENAIATAINIFPNPTKGIFTVALATITKNNTITVNDMLGRVVVNQKLSAMSTVIDLTGNNKGVYFVNIQTDNGVIVRKIILE